MGNVVITAINYVLEAICLCFVVLIAATILLYLNPKYCIIGIIGFGIAALIRATWMNAAIVILSALNWVDEKLSTYKEYQLKKLS